MSAQVFIHPAVGLQALSDLCLRAGLRASFVHKRTGAVGCVLTAEPPRTPGFRCRCGWTGLDPDIVDMDGTPHAHLGEVAMCPSCRVHAVSHR